jgi:hypothetical protein
MDERLDSEELRPPRIRAAGRPVGPSVRIVKRPPFEVFETLTAAMDEEETQGAG